MTPLHVLLVESSDEDALRIERELRGAGWDLVLHRVQTAAELQAAMEAAEWDIVVSDDSLPGVIAPEVIERVRKIDPDVPIVVASGAAGEERVAQTMRLGANDYVMKDNLQRLAAAVERGLREARVRRTARRLDQQVREREWLMTQAQRLAHVGSYSLDLRTGTIEWSDETYRIFGRRPEWGPLTLTVFADAIHPNDRERVMGSLEAALEGGSFEERFRIVQPNGEVRWIEDRLEVERNHVGEPVRIYGVCVDVTERERAAEELRESERRYRELIETAAEGIWAINLKGQTTFVNRHMAAMLGWRPHEMVGRHYSEFNGPPPPEVPEGFKGDVAPHLTRVEARLVTRSGGHVSTLFSIAPLRNAAREVVGFLGMVTDITSLKAAEEALRESERALLEAQRIAKLGNWVWDLDAGTVQLSDATRELFGLRRNTIAFDEVMAMFRPEDRPRALQGIRDAIAGVHYQAEMRMVVPRGELTVSLAGEIRLENGRPRWLIGTVQDVTERRQVEAERSRLERELALLLESTIDAIIAVDAQGRCTMVNSAASTLTGYTPDELIGRPLDEALPQPPDGFSLEQVLATRQPVQLPDVAFACRNETWIPVDLTASPLIERDELRGAVITMRDITERKLMQGELERANRLTSLGRMAATIAHEFNNVLMGIQPFAETIERRVGDSDTRRATEHIRRALQRGRNITREILRFTRPTTPDRDPVPVAEMFEHFGGELRAILPPTIELRIANPDQGLIIEGDREQLVQILTNLAINARDAMKGRGALEIEARRCCSGETYPFGVVPTSDRFAEIIVRDTGPGIPEEIVPHVFDPFFSTKKSGTGLGLAVAHQVVKLHGGHIFAESRVGRGTTFHLFLPLTAESMEALPPDTAAPASPAHLEVLLVEDDEAVAAGIGALLDLEGMRYRIAGSGAAAIAELERALPDVLLLDVGLPDIDGRELFRQIERRHPGLPVVFSSGHAEAAPADGPTRAGVEWVLKPYELDELLRAIAAVTSERTG